MTESSLLSSKLPSSALPHPHTSNDVKMQQAGADATNIIIAAAGQEKDSSLATLQPHTSAASALIIPNHPTKSLKHLPLPSLNPHLTEVNNNSNFESTPPTASPNIMSTKIHHKRQVSKASSISNINGNNNGSGDSGVRKRTKSSLKKSNSSSVGFVAKKGIHEVIQTNNTTAAITGGIVALQSGIAADSNNNENHPQDNNETLLAVGAVNTPNSHQPDSSPTSAVDEVEEDVTDLATRGRTNSDIKRWIKGTQMASVLVQPPIPIMKGGGSGGDGRTRYLAGHNGHGQGDGGGMLGELESDADLLDDGEEHEMMEIHHQQPQHPHHHLYHSYPPPTHHHHNHHSHHHHQRNNNNRHHHQHTANENDGEEEENEGDHVVMSAFDSEIFDPQFDGDDDGNDNSTSHAVRGYHVVKSTSNAGGIREILIEEEEQDESQKKTEIDGKTKKEQKTKREDSKKRGLLRHQKQKDEDIKNHTRKDDSAAAADNDIGGASISTVQSINIIGRKTSIVNGNLANALMFTLPKSTTNTSISAAETATIISSSVHVSNSSLHSKTNKSHKSNTSNNISNNRPRSLIIPAPPTLPAPKPPSLQSSATSASPPSRHHSSSNNGRKETSSNLKSPSSTLRVHGEQRSLTRSNTVDRKRALVELAGGGGDGGDKIIPNRKTSIAERRKSKQLPGPLIIDDSRNYMHPPSARIRSEDVITSASIDSLTGNNNRKKVSTVAAENIIDPFDEDILLHNPSIMKRRNLLFPEFISAASPTHEHSPYFRMGSGQDLLVVSSSGVGTVTNNIPSSTDDSSAATGTAIPHVRKRSIEWDDLKTGTYLIASPIIYDNDDNDSQFRHQVDATQIQISTNPTGTFIAKGSSNHRGGESGGSSVGGTGWFRVEKILHTSPRHKIVRATRLLDDLKCILKMASYPDKRRSASSIHEDLLDDETERLNSEFLAYQTAKTLDVRNIPRIIGIEDSGQVRMRFMIMEDIGGESLTRIVQSRMQSISDGIANIRQDSLPSGLLISEALFLFYHVTKVLLDLHGGEMYHKAITPDNIVCNFEKSKIQVIDLSWASKLTNEQIAYSPADQKWKSCWPYLPFELLNLNEPFADHKSDLYGLGSVMYFALTGRSPFEDAIKCDNIYELRYEQLMQNVVSPSELYPDVIPPVLSDVVMKLIKWSPNERYQAASGLLADIRELIYISKSDAGMVAAATITSNADGDSTTATSNRRSPLFHVEDFPLSDDIPINMFQIPKHVLRRGYDLRVMVKSFEKVKESKTSSCLFISGGVGVGKTKFLNEAENYIIARRGVWIKTNCENQFHSPYGPISSILEEIGKSINNLPFDVRDVIVNDIMFACQGMGQVLLDLCPALKNVLGIQPQLPLLTPRENQNRFNWVIKRFFSVIGSPERPYAIVFDDFDAADHSTVSLLQQVLSAESIHILFGFVYLDNGINESNSIVRIKHHIKSDSHISSEELHLQPLKIEHVAAILSNMTNLDPEHVKLKDLSRFIYHKTYGVPLLLHEILSHLKEKNMFKLIKKPASMSRTNSNDKISGTGESGVQQQQQEQKTDEEIGENVFWDWDLNMIMSEVSRFNISARAHLRAENIMTATTVDGTRLLLRNVRGLSKTCRRFLQLGSVLGRTFSLGPLVLGQKYHPSDIISDLNILLAKGYLSPVTFWASRLGDHIDQKYLLQLIKSDKLLFKFECDEFYRCVYQVNSKSTKDRVPPLHLWAARVTSEFYSLANKYNQENMDVSAIQSRLRQFSLNTLSQMAYHYLKGIKEGLNSNETDQLLNVVLAKIRAGNAICAYGNSVETFNDFEEFITERLRDGSAESSQLSLSSASHKAFVNREIVLEAAKASSVVSEFLDKFHNLMNLLQMDIESGQTDRSLVNSLYDVEATAMLGHNENEAVAQQAVNELKLYRVKLQEHPNTDDLRFALFWLKWRMGAVIRSTMDNDMNLKSPLLILIPESEDRNLSVIKASRALLKATYKDASDLFFYASIKCMRWCLKQKRRNELFPLLFASIAMITTRFAVSSGNFKSLKNVVHLVSASRAFDEVYWNQPERMIGSCITHAFVNHWTEPLRTCLEPLLENVKESLLFGEPELACESFCTWLRYSLYAGEKLSGVIEQILIHLPMLSSTHIVNNPRWLVVLAAYLKCVKTLCNQQVPETWPIIDVSDDFVKKTIEKDEMASYLVSCAESYTAFMNKDWRTALRWSTMAIPSFRNDKHLIPKILLDFPMVRFVGVIAAIQLLIHNETMVRRSQKQKKEEQGNRVHPSTGQNASSPPNNSSLHVVMSKPEKQALLTLANNGKNFFKKLAASQATSAVNHAHKYQFILAEFDIYRGSSKKKVISLFQAAVEGSEQQSFFSDAIIAQELLSQHLRDKFSDMTEASISMKKAIDLRAKFLE